MASPLVFVVPGQLGTLTGGSVYNKRMIDTLRQHYKPVAVCELDNSFPKPTSAALEHAKSTLAALPTDSIVVIDGLALGAIPEIITLEAQRLCIVALVHLPIAKAIGLEKETAIKFAASEHRALSACTAIVVTGRTALDMLLPYGLVPNRITVVEPGTNPASLAIGSYSGELQLLSVATLSPGKGHAILLQALTNLAHHQWHLTCIGNLTRYPATVKQVRSLIHEFELHDRVSLVGELEETELEQYYSKADVFVLPTLLETYGMAVAEALARGLPVISTTTGAIPQLVGNDAGILVPVGDLASLTRALAKMIANEEIRISCSKGARRVRGLLPNWKHSASSFATVLEKLENRE